MVKIVGGGKYLPHGRYQQKKYFRNFLYKTEGMFYDSSNLLLPSYQSQFCQ